MYYRRIKAKIIEHLRAENTDLDVYGVAPSPDQVSKYPYIVVMPGNSNSTPFEIGAENRTFTFKVMIVVKVGAREQLEKGQDNLERHLDRVIEQLYSRAFRTRIKDEGITIINLVHSTVDIDIEGDYMFSTVDVPMDIKMVR